VAPRRDVEALAAGLERAATDGALRENVAAAGLARITTAFDWERAVNRLEAWLRSAASLTA